MKILKSNDVNDQGSYTKFDFFQHTWYRPLYNLNQAHFSEIWVCKFLE
jgi:hypothetical protein